MRRSLHDRLSNECFDALVGGTDSELLFQLMLINGLRRDPDLAIKTTIREIDRLPVERKITEAFRVTLALTKRYSSPSRSTKASQNGRQQLDYRTRRVFF